MISKIRRLGIKTKWMIYTFIFIILFSSVLVSFFLTSGKRDLEKELKKWGVSLTKNLAENARTTVQNEDYATLKNYLYGVMNYKEIIYSVIIDKSGSILAIEDPRSMVTSQILDGCLNLNNGKVEEIYTSDEAKYYNMAEPIIIEKIIDNKTNSIHHDPIERVVTEINGTHSRQSNERLGTVILGISLEEMNIKLERMRNRAIYIAFMSTLFVIAFVFWGVNRLTKPIKELEKATRKVALGDLNHIVEIGRVDELGRLANSFNEMIVKLKESQQKVENYTQTLERTVAERTHELKLSEQKYRTLFEHAGTAVALIDEKGKFLMVNKRFENLSGLTKKNIEHEKMLSDFLSPEDCKNVKQLYNSRKPDLEINQMATNHECTFIDFEQNSKKINLTISEIPGTIDLLVSIVDVTELRDLQKRLARSEQLAVLGELSAAIAHEIRNPLVAINTSVGILKNGLNLVGEDEELMNIISEESMRLNKIVDDFLKFARPNEPQLIQTDINVLIQETMLLLKGRLNGVHTQVRLLDKLPAISGDPDQLKQVLMNMIINAIEAMPDGGLIEVTTQFIQPKNTHPSTEIRIKDTGNGIKENDLKKIFQPFFSTKKNGIGMGLAVCERIIQNHDGVIKVESELGQGTEFTIVLPMK